MPNRPDDLVVSVEPRNDGGASAKADRAAGLRPEPASPSQQSSIPSAEVLLQKIAEAEKRAEACEAALARAVATLSDLQTAHRVIYGVGGVMKIALKLMPTAARQKAIIDLLGEGPENAKPPAVLYDEYWALGHEKIKIDTFRTSIWRMVNLYRFHSWEICSDERGYWKSPAQAMSAGTAKTEGLGPKDASAVRQDAPETDRNPHQEDTTHDTD